MWIKQRKEPSQILIYVCFYDTPSAWGTKRGGLQLSWFVKTQSYSTSWLKQWTEDNSGLSDDPKSLFCGVFGCFCMIDIVFVHLCLQKVQVPARKSETEYFQTESKPAEPLSAATRWLHLIWCHLLVHRCVLQWGYTISGETVICPQVFNWERCEFVWARIGSSLFLGLYIG